MYPQILVEANEPDPMVVQRRILLAFLTTVLSGIILCTAYLTRPLHPGGQSPSPAVTQVAVASQVAAASPVTAARRVTTATQFVDGMVIRYLPDPPAPLPERASPSPAADRTAAEAGVYLPDPP